MFFVFKVYFGHVYVMSSWFQRSDRVVPVGHDVTRNKC